jgi:hypothetical protein
MTPEQPTAERLLATCRQVLKDEILPQTPEASRLDLLMVLNALGLAERTLDDSRDELAGRQDARLQELLGGTGDAGTLAAAIRSGAWDDRASAERLHAALTADARDRLARANPKYLATVDAEDAEGEDR